MISLAMWCIIKNTSIVIYNNWCFFVTPTGFKPVTF